MSVQIEPWVGLAVTLPSKKERHRLEEERFKKKVLNRLADLENAIRSLRQENLYAPKETLAAEKGKI